MTVLNTTYLSLTLFTVLFSGCDTEHVYSNNGVVCAYGAVEDVERFSVEPVMFSTGVVFQYSVPYCLSSSCDTDRTAHCSVKTDGNTIRVTSTASYSSSFSIGCTDDCGTVSAICQTEELPAGEYRIIHGTEEMTLTLPSTSEPPCIHTQ